MGSAFMEIRCVNCEFQEDCRLREIAPDLYGCMGHGRLHHRFAEQAEKEKAEFQEKRAKALAENEKQVMNLRPGDKVQLKGTTISLGLRLPRYLDNGCFTVLGVSRNGKIICDWDGGKPFHIPALCLNKLAE